VKPLVFIVDDDDLVRRGFSRLLDSAGYEVQSFASAREFLDRSHRDSGPACLVLDVQMPELTGLDLQEELRTDGAILPIVFVSGRGDIPMTVRAIKAGAMDFLTKPVSEEALLEAVAQALARAARITAEHAEVTQIRTRAATLTPREREVLEFVISGLMNKQIADALGTAEQTIKVHRARILKKMGVRSVAELVHDSARIGIVPRRQD